MIIIFSVLIIILITICFQWQPEKKETYNLHYSLNCLHCWSVYSILLFNKCFDVYFLFYFFKIHEFQQEVPQSQEESLDGKGSTPLPVLCIEDGMVILRFSEIFGIHEPLKKGEKRDRRFSIPKGIWMYNMISSSSFLKIMK